MESPLRCPLPPDGQSSPKEEEEVGEEGEEGEDVEVLKNFFYLFYLYVKGSVPYCC